jgi:hypothetical protein
MEKTYRLLDHTEPMPVTEIRRLYRGYWVYIVKATFNEFNGLVSGVPVVIGAKPFDGVDDGIYDEFDTDEYGQHADMRLLLNKTIEYIRQFAGETNE